MATRAFARRGRVTAALLGAITLAGGALAASSPARQTQPATAAGASQPASGPAVAGPPRVGPVSAPAAPPPAWWERLEVPSTLWPDLSWVTLSWFAAVVILALLLRLKPLLSLRNLDALVLAAMCLLLALREAEASGAAGTGAPRFSYIGLTILTGYWLVRGAWLLIAKPAARERSLAPSGSLCVLLVAGLALAIHQVAVAPLTPGARDGLVGGLFTAESGKLPYGDTLGHDAQSPLLYLMHAGAVKVAEPVAMVGQPEAPVLLTWANRAAWLQGDWWDQLDPTPSRLVSAMLFIGTLAGIYVIGRWLTAPATCWTMAAVLCVFPGTLECLARPEIMLPTMLLTWTIAFAMLPAVGGLLATLCLVLAGLAWPWAWLGLPVLLAYFARRGWQTVGSVAGLVAGIALLVVGLATLVQPALPRLHGALEMAGRPPHFTARLGEGGTVMVRRREVEPADRRSWFEWVWGPLVDNDSLRVRPTGSIDWGVGVEGSQQVYSEIHAVGDALPPLQADYRRAVAELPGWRRLVAALRTVLDATWVGAAHAPTTPFGAWEMWGGPPAMDARWVNARRGVKAAVGLLMVWATLTIFVRRKTQPPHLIGALLAVTSGTLLASETGAATNLIWLMPAVLSLGALSESPQEQAPPAAEQDEVPLEPEPPPRITAEN